MRFLAASADSDELILETESCTQPPAILRCSVHSNRFDLWAQRDIPFNSERYGQTRVWYASKDGTRVPMFLVGRRDVLKGGCHPAIMTSYGG